MENIDVETETPFKNMDIDEAMEEIISGLEEIDPEEVAHVAVIAVKKDSEADDFYRRASNDSIDGYNDAREPVAAIVGFNFMLDRMSFDVEVDDYKFPF